MVSINVFSVLLKIIIPIKTIIIMNDALYVSDTQLKLPAPVNPYLNVSIIGAIGLYITNFLYVSGIAETGYITGVTYIKSVMPNEITYVRSRYLVVKEDMIIPVPNAMPPIKITSTGSSSRYLFGVMLPL
jgi:hypothetical protein